MTNRPNTRSSIRQTRLCHDAMKRHWSARRACRTQRLGADAVRSSSRATAPTVLRWLQHGGNVRTPGATSCKASE